MLVRTEASNFHLPDDGSGPGKGYSGEAATPRPYTCPSQMLPLWLLGSSPESLWFEVVLPDATSEMAPAL